ncbi:MAG: class A beta-lactamase-related serine hydrolase [Chloroflexi bacterium]|nr:MAG: class A beta-lactamase-related serine hydrolase [Chloroflexota bacterium]MBL1196154.1 class A beta-lactamase-related serine hydrolase [Chloroflexota bacterium]NOH13447.1 beta-lactamase family protein [Chloroflexota bacterium]
MTSNPTIKQAIDYSQLTDPASLGMSAQGVENIRRIFREQYEQGLHPAAQLVVLRHGQVVVDEVIGRHRGQPISHSTPFLGFSLTKPFTAMCVHKLIAEGLIEMDAPIAEYWPEFGQKGKELATVRHAFLHQVGVPSRGLYTQIFRWPFWGAVTRNVANLPLEFEPGSEAQYHIVNYGFIMGELVRRVTGMSIDDYVRKHFLQPLGLKRTWMRIPRHELSNSPKLYATGPNQRSTTWLFNLPIIRRALIPAASLHSTAREIAVFFQMLLNGGEYAGRRFLQAETIEAATQVGYEGFDASFNREVLWAYGFHLGGKQPPPGVPGPSMGVGSTANTFGHSGNASCYAWADKDQQLVYAFMCNGLLDQPLSLHRWTDLADAVWDAVER